jgi:arylsulfatase
MGQQNGTPPWERGFMRSLNSRFGEVYFPKEDDRPGTKMLYLNGREIPKDSPEIGHDWYSTDLFTDWGLKFIDEARAEKKPFFLYLAQGAAHFPLRAPAEVIAKYRGKYMAGWDKLREQRHAKQVAMGLIDPKWTVAPRPQEVRAWDEVPPDRQDRFDNIMAVYAAMIDRIDFAMGTLVDGLRQRGLLDNTLLLFLSDNGGNAEGGPAGTTNGEGPIGGPDSYVQLGMSWATLANTPFFRYKHFTHEGGISTPLIAHWPRGLAAERRGSFIKDPGHLVDLMATCVDLGAAKYPTERNGTPIVPMEGTTLRPAFTGQPLARKQPIFWEHEGNKAVRDGRWKLVMRHKLPWQLFDMEADRTEQHDLSKEHPEIASRLISTWEGWAQRSFVDEWNGPDHGEWGNDIPRPKAAK